MLDGQETGTLFEERVLGRCLVKWDGRTYMSFRHSLDQVKQSQPWDPRRPACPTARRLHAAAAEALGDCRGELRLYTAVGSPMDRFHGADAVFEFRGNVVTVDVTTNPRKDSWKADLVFHSEDIEDIAAFGSRVAREFSTKMKGGVRAWRSD